MKLHLAFINSFNVSLYPGVICPMQYCQ